MAVQGSSASMAAGLELSWAFARPSPRTIMRKRGSSPGILRGPAPPPPPAGRPGAPAAGTRALFTPDPLFLVWMEGLPAQEGWSFHYEYVEPCVARYGGAFLADRCAQRRCLLLAAPQPSLVFLPLSCTSFAALSPALWYS